MAANLELTARMAKAARAAPINFPLRSINVTRHEELYWRTMSEGTKLKFPPPLAATVPKLWDYTECMEVDGQVGRRHCTLRTCCCLLTTAYRLPTPPHFFMMQHQNYRAV